MRRRSSAAELVTAARRLTLGTAGHIDHGKTRLVEALTGTDTDRLPEEKRRGISIALGYAQLELPDGTRLSVVDVPGHERFVRTMVAGATGIDLFLLVVDAGEGPKPQTHEHLEILRLLGIEQGVVALTKVDAVDEARVQASEAAVRSCCPGHEVVRVSAVDGIGLRGARRRARARCRGGRPAPPRRAGARLYVDRSFSLPGAGRIVTGTLWSGSVAPGDRLQVLPDGYEVRVRSVEVHGEQVERAAAGQRVALAVSVRAEAPARAGRRDRGAGLASFRPTDSTSRSTRPRAIEGDGGLTVCHGTSAVPGRLVRAHGGLAQLRLAKPLAAARGDRVVLRRQTTVGGARVLDPEPAAPHRRAPPRAPRAGRCRGARRGARRRAGRDRGGEDAPGPRRRGLSRASTGFVRVDGWLLSAGVARDGASRGVGGGRGAGRRGRPRPDRGRAPRRRAVGGRRRAAARPRAAPREALRPRPAAATRAATAASSPRGSPRRASSRSPSRTPTSRASSSARVGLVRLGDGLAIGREAYDEYRRLLVEEFDAAGTITLAAFRDRAGVSRRVAQLVLERFDADRLTLRVGDQRRLRRSAREA